jgi:hypothetical protein
MLLFIKPIPELHKYITRIWLFQSNTGLPGNNIIPPNARSKIIIPFKGTITTRSVQVTRTCAEGRIYFIGVRDVPVALSTPKAKTGSIGIEFTTEGAYRFFNGSMNHLVNDLFSFEDCFGEEGQQVQHQIQDLEGPYDKVQAIQHFLLFRLQSLRRTNGIIDYSIDLVQKSHGLIGIRELERKTGYTK